MRSYLSFPPRRIIKDHNHNNQSFAVAQRHRFPSGNNPEQNSDASCHSRGSSISNARSPMHSGRSPPIPTHPPSRPSPSLPPSSSLKTTKQYLREVVVERRADDMFDVQIKQVPDIGPVAIGNGFFPNDRLVSLNDRSLDTVDAEKVNRIIRSLAGRTLTVQVLSLVTHDGDKPIMGDGRNENGGGKGPDRHSIKRFGTMKATARQENREMENVFWLIDIHGYSAVQLLERSGQSARVKYLHPSRHGRMIEVNGDWLDKANDSQFDMSDDLSTLQFINETALLQVIRTRSRDGYNCSFIGSSILVVVNGPGSSTDARLNRRVDSCCSHNGFSRTTANTIEDFLAIRRLRPQALPPHLFAPAYRANTAVLRGGSGQSIVVMGVKGSSKMTVVEHSLKYLACAHSISKNLEKDCQVIDDIMTLTAACVGSTESEDTDCAKIYKLGIDGHGRMCNLNVELLLINRSRLFYRVFGSFKLISAVACCDNPQLVKHFALDEVELGSNLFLSNTNRSKCQDLWRMIFMAFDRLGIPDAIVSFILAMTAVILHLGAVDTSKLGGVSLVQAREVCMTSASFRRIAAILNIEEDLLLDVVFHYSDQDEIASTEKELTPLRFICGFAVACYNCVVEAVQIGINQAQDTGNEVMKTINVLECPDISRFRQDPPTPAVSFPQMVNNYFNEKLHFILNEAMFEAPLKELAVEHPNLPIVRSKFHAFEYIKHVMEDTRSSNSGVRFGLLRILDDSDLTHEDIVRQIAANAWKSGDSTVSLVDNPAVFCLRHFGGQLPVIYDPSSWYAVHRDLPVSERFASIFDNSKKSYISNVRKLLLSRGSDNFAWFKRILRPVADGRIPSSVVSRCTAERIEAETRNILLAVRSSEVHLCYCLNDGLDMDSPESERSADVEIRKQMQAFRLVSTAVSCQKDTIIRTAHREFVERFAGLVKDFDARNLSKMETSEKLMRELNVNSFEYKTTKADIFTRQSVQKDLEGKRYEVIEIQLIKIQSLCRGRLVRKRVTNIQLRHRALMCIQRNGRAFLEIRHSPWWKLFVAVKSVLPIINHEEQIQSFKEELAKVQQQLQRSEAERKNVAELNTKLEETIDYHRGMVDQIRSQENNSLIEERERNAELTDLVGKLKVQLERTQNSPISESDIRADNDDMKTVTSSDYQSLLDRNADLAVRCDLLETKCEQMHHEVDSCKESNTFDYNKLRFLQKKEERHLSDMSELQDMIDQLLAANNHLKESNQKLEQENQELEQRLQDDQQSVVSSGSRQRSVSSCTNSEIPSTSADFDEVVSKLKGQIRHSERLANNYKEEVQELNDLLFQAEQARLKSDLELQQERKKFFADMEAKDQEMDASHENFQRRLKLQGEKLDEESNNNDQLRKKLRELESKMMEYKTKDGRYPEIIDQQKKKLQQYKILLNESRFQMDQLQNTEENDLLMKSLKSKISDLEFDNQSLERSRLNLKLKNEELTQDLENIKKQKEKAEEIGCKFARERESAVESMEESEKEMDELVDKLAIQTKQLASYQSEVGMLRVEVETLQIEKSNLEEKINELEFKLLTHQRQSLGSEISPTESGNTSSPKSVAEYKVDELQSILEMETLAKSRLQHHVDRLREQVTGQTETISRLENEISVLQSHLSGRQSEYRELNSAYSSLKSQHSQMKNEQARITAEEAVMMKEVASLKSQLKTAKEHINVLSSVLEDEDDDEIFIAQSDVGTQDK